MHTPLRTRRTAALLAALLLGVIGPAAAQAPTPATPAAAGRVAGMVRGVFQGGVRPLPSALVEAWAPGVRRTIMADSSGHYALMDLPAGPVRIRVTHAGHDPQVLDVLVPAGDEVVVDMELRARPVEMPALDVTTETLRVPDPDRRDPLVDPRSETEIATAVIEGGSGLSQTGLAQALQSLAGNEPGNATDVLFMRGSTTDLKLVLLDGAPVFTPFHVAGLLRSFEPAVLGRADLHVGGAPARFDGGLTSILDLRTRRPGRDGLHASGSLDLVSGTVAVDGPLFPGTGFVASARSLHDLGTGALGSSPYGYRDVLASVETELADAHRLKSTVFWNRESVVLDLPEVLEMARLVAPDEADWSNRAASAVYQGRVGDVFVDATVAGGDYRASLPLQPTAPRGEPRPDPLMASATNRRLRSGLEISRPGARGVWRAGVGYEHLDASYGAVVLGTGRPTLDARASAHTVGGYVDVTRTVASEVSLRFGLRADRFSGPDGGLRLAPRAALAWSVGPTALLTVAAGRYHQHARVSDVRVGETLAQAAEGGFVAADGEALLAGEAIHPVATADHVVVSLEQELGGGTTLGLEGFWKGFDGIRPDQDAPILNSGVDLRIQRRTEALTGWIGYGLSWFWSSMDLSGEGAEFTGRHLLTAGLDGRLNDRFGGEVRLAYGAGLPYTSLPFASGDALAGESPEAPEDRPTEVLESASPFAGGPEDSFLRLDVELHATLRPQWAGRTWTIQPYVRVLNALDRRDALFYAFQPWRDEALTPLAERPVVPILGVAWRF